MFGKKSGKSLDYGIVPADTKIRRHVMVKLDTNPYLDRGYFLERLGKVQKRTP